MRYNYAHVWYIYHKYNVTPEYAKQVVLEANGIGELAIRFMEVPKTEWNRIKYNFLKTYTSTTVERLVCRVFDKHVGSWNMYAKLCRYWDAPPSILIRNKENVELSEDQLHDIHNLIDEFENNVFERVLTFYKANTPWSKVLCLNSQLTFPMIKSILERKGLA